MSRQNILCVLFFTLAIALTCTPAVYATDLVNLPCNYMVFQSGGTTYAQSCSGAGTFLYSSTNAGTVINDAIGNMTSGGKLFIKAGTYTFTTAPINLGSGDYGAIGTTSVSNIELYGEGNATILTIATNLNHAAIAVLNAGGWYIHDLQIDGNRANQNAGGASPADLAGLFLYNSNGDTIAHCYIHDNKDYGIDIYGNSEQILHNWIVNSNANGILTDGGSGYVIEGNIVTGASDIGISISGGPIPVINVVCDGNIVGNINLGVSPFVGSNDGVGIDVGDDEYAMHVTVSSNIITGGVLVGLQTLPLPGNINSDILLLGNQIHSATEYAIYSNYETRLTIKDNVINNAAGQGIFVRGTTSLDIENNVLNNIHNTGIEIYAGITDAIITGNHLVNIKTNYGIKISNTNYVLVSDNSVDNVVTGIYTVGEFTNIVGNNVLNVGYEGIMLDSGSEYSSVVGNTITMTGTSGNLGMVLNDQYLSVSNNYVYAGQNGIVVLGTANGASLNGNYVKGATYPISGSRWIQAAITATGVMVTNNVGYNPIGKVTSFISSTTISPYGSSSSLTASTTYTITFAPCLIIFQTGGTGVSVSINGGTGFTPTIGESFTLYPGETINFGGYSGVPTLQVIFS